MSKTRVTHILEMNTRELLAYLCEETAFISSNKAAQVLIATAITRHQNDTKRAADLLAAIKENAQ